MTEKPLVFGVIGADHQHIYAMTAGMEAAGAVCKGWWTKEEPVTIIARNLHGAGGLITPFPHIPRVKDRRELLDDPEIELILTAAMPSERATFSIEAMRHGKDVMSDKPGILSLAELAEIRRTVAETGRIWSVNWSERHQVPSMIKAAELVEQGLIGDVVQVLGLGPHRPRPQERPWWYFEPEKSGGIMGYLASHQIDHFLFYSGSTNAEIISSSLGNFAFPEYPRFEDFGEILLRSDKASGYVRVDWYSPTPQPHPGDNRLFIAGTKGQIEVRKYVDVGGRPGTDHLFLMTGERSEYVDCTNVPIVYFKRLADDVRNRTATTASQEHSFVVTELAIRAMETATRLGHLAKG